MPNNCPSLFISKTIFLSCLDMNPSNSEWYGNALTLQVLTDKPVASKISSIYYNSSEAALSFHIGVMLALDSLRKKGKNIVLHTFDTNKDTIKTHKLVDSKLLDKMDIIIGPLYARNFNILCRKYIVELSISILKMLTNFSLNKRFLCLLKKL